MENFPEQENEKVDKIKLLEQLRAKGIEDPETRALVEQWSNEQEEQVAQANNSRAPILFNIDRADLYLAIGDIEGALGCLDDARRQAFQENETDLYDEIMKKMDSVG